MSLPVPDPISETKTIFFVAIAVLVAAVIGYLAYTKSLLQTEVAQDATLIVEYRTQNDDWKVKTDEANKAIKALQDEVLASQQAVEAAQKQAEVVQQQHDIVAHNIETILPFGDDCAATKKILDNYFRGKKK